MTELFCSQWKKLMPILVLILNGWLNSVNAFSIQNISNCNLICINGNCTTNCSSSGSNCNITCNNGNCTNSCDSSGEQIVGSGNLQIKFYDFSGFTQINGKNTFDITITKDHSHRIEITADDNMFEHLNIHQKGGILYLTTENGSFSNLTLQATITMPSLEKINLSGSSNGTFSGFTSNRLQLNMSGSSELIGNSGTASLMIVNMSGSSELDLEEMISSEADMRMSGASEASITLDGTGVLSGNLSGSSTLNYCGTPTQNTVTTNNQSTVINKCTHSPHISAKVGDVIGTNFTAPDNRIDIYDFSIFMLYLRDKLIPRVDYNRDGVVNAADNDANFLETHFDLNNDGKVELNDVKVIQASDEKVGEF